MTQTVTQTSQSEVRRFVEGLIKSPSDFGNGISLKSFGIDGTLTFLSSRTLFTRGLTLLIQNHQRPSSTKKLNDRIKYLEDKLSKLEE